jgi:hypothetical protein
LNQFERKSFNKDHAKMTKQGRILNQYIPVSGASGDWNRARGDKAG